VAYGFGRGLSKTVLVYDLGGGTFDASLLRIDGNRMEVIATDGDPFLGGSDFDDRLTEWVLMRFERRTGMNLRDDPVAVQRVRFAAEEAKRTLSDARRARIEIPFIVQTARGSMDLDVTVTRDQYDELTQDLLERTLGIVQGVLDSGRVPTDGLDDVILVGGQSRAPAVARLLYERFGRRPSRQVHPDEAVALGAGIVAAAIDSPDPVELADVVAVPIRMTLPDGGTEVLFDRGNRLPAERTIPFPLTVGAVTQLALCRGDKPQASENTTLGYVTLPPAAGPGAAVTVTVRVTGDGLLSVRATHPAVGTVTELAIRL